MRNLKWIWIILLAILLGVGGYFAYKRFSDAHKPNRAISSSKWLAQRVSPGNGFIAQKHNITVPKTTFAALASNTMLGPATRGSGSGGSTVGSGNVDRFALALTSFIFQERKNTEIVFGQYKDDRTTYDSCLKQSACAHLLNSEIDRKVAGLNPLAPAGIDQERWTLSREIATIKPFMDKSHCKSYFYALYPNPEHRDDELFRKFSKQVCGMFREDKRSSRPTDDWKHFRDFDIKFGNCAGL